jgi:NAD(P)-dependent dehydrogenase (short-subunit alcohol dehydrogenase family)
MDGERFALVTGAGSGVGKASALALARTGWHVALTGRRSELLEETAGEVKALGRRALPKAADVADPEAVKALFAEIEREFGRLDLLFNNAGRGAPAVPIDELPYETWKAVVDVNLNGMFLCAQGAFGLMKRQKPQGGRIINNGSISAHTPRPMAISYNATKHADRDGPSHDLGRHTGRWAYGGRADHGPERGRRRRGEHGQPAALDQCAHHDHHGDQDAVRRARIAQPGGEF